MSECAKKARLRAATDQAQAAASNGQARALLGVWSDEQKLRFLDSLRLDPKFRADVRELLAKE